MVSSQLSLNDKSRDLLETQMSVPSLTDVSVQPEAAHYPMRTWFPAQLQGPWLSTNALVFGMMASIDASTYSVSMIAATICRIYCGFSLMIFSGVNLPQSLIG